MRVFVACTVLSLAAGSPGQEVLSGPKDLVSMTLPTGWKYDKKRLQKTGLESKRKSYQVLEFPASPAESRNGVYVELTVAQEARLQMDRVMRRNREIFLAQKGTTCERGDKPGPHFVLESKSNGRTIKTVIGYRIEGGRLIQLRLQCLPATWENVQEPFFAMLKSVQIKAPKWPVHPAGRQDQVQKDVLYSLAPGLKKKLLREVQKCVAGVKKGLEKQHGSIKLSGREPLRVYVNELSADHKRIAEEDSVQKVVNEPGHGRLFTTPMEARGSKQRTFFADAVAVQLLSEVYGGPAPLWFITGERMIAREADVTKKPLPSVERAVLKSLHTSNTFAKLAAIKQDSSIEFSRECQLFVSLFHIGPKPYQAAYDAFLKQWKETGDFLAATEKHLLSLDQPKMRDDANALVKKLRGVRVKR